METGSTPQSGWAPPRIETPRLLLRPVTRDDAEAIYSYASNPNVSKYTLWEPHQTVQDSLKFIEDYIFHYYSKEVPEPWGMALKTVPERLIGTIGCFWTFQHSRAMEIAYALAEDHWGKGFVAEAANEVLEYCFTKYNLKRIQARCKVENTASARVMEKIGMTHEGTLRSAVFHRERFWDLHLYAKVAD